MNELKLVVLGLVVLVFSVVLLRIFEAPEIIEDKEVEIASALGIGLLILVLDKRSNVTSMKRFISSMILSTK